jgi:hypothetical protein
MRRGWLLAFAAAIALAIAGLAVTMASDDRPEAFTLGVVPREVAAVLRSGEQVCQLPINVPADAAAAGLQIGTYRHPGQPLELTVRSRSGVSGRARLKGGYPDNSKQRARVGGIGAGQRISLCVRNLGRRRVALYGGTAGAARRTAAFLEGKYQPTDLTLVFYRQSPRSALAAVPDVFERASLFHATWIDSWLLWVMAAVVVIGVPLVLVRALAAAQD